MRLVFNKTQHPITQGLASTFSYCGFDVFLWDNNIKSVYDMFDEKQPDILFIYQKDINNTILDALSEFNKKCVVLECDGIFEPFISFNPLPACNPVQYGKGQPLLRYNTDVMYFSYIDNPKFLNFVEVMTKYKLKIFGPKYIAFPQYMGYLSSHKEYSNAIRSSRVFVDTNGFDILNAAMLGVPSVGFGLNPSLYPEELFKSYKTPQELDKAISDTMSQIFNQDIKNFALNNTFFHRTFDLLVKLEHTNKANEVLNKWNAIRSEF